MCLASSKAEVLETLNQDIYAKTGVWDMDKVRWPPRPIYKEKQKSNKTQQVQIYPFKCAFRTP